MKKLLALAVLLAVSLGASAPAPAEAGMLKTAAHTLYHVAVYKPVEFALKAGATFCSGVTKITDDATDCAVSLMQCVYDVAQDADRAGGK